MMINRRSIPRLFFFYTTIIIVIFALSSATLKASDLSETYKDGVRFELRLASMEEVDGWKRATDPWNQPVWISPAISLSNSDVAQASAEERGETYSVSLLLNEEGMLKLARLTKANVGKYVAVMVNERAVSVPRIMDEIIGGRAEIAGNFSKEEAQLIAEGIIEN